VLRETAVLMLLLAVAACSDPGASSIACDAACGALVAESVSRDRFAQDVATVAQPRTPGSPGWQAVQDLCADRFSAAGFAVEKQSYGTGVNVIGTLASGAPGPRVLLSAHYDHIAGCAGADDNASGVAGVLEAARILGGANLAGTLIVACWDEEERGLVGSMAYAARAKSRGETIDAAFVLDMIGYRSRAPGSQTLPAGFETLFPAEAAQVAANGHAGDFVAVVFNPSARRAADAFAAAGARAALPVVALELPESQRTSVLAADLSRSDQANFWVSGTPALLVDDTMEYRNPHYHCRGGPDAPSDLDADFATAVVRAQVGALAMTLGTRP
jgi:Zn-dependent M28 family amino/carboxypeptidase